MIKVEPHSPQGVYDTLLELRLQDWAHEEDAAVSSAHLNSDSDAIWCNENDKYKTKDVVSRYNVSYLVVDMKNQGLV